MTSQSTKLVKCTECRWKALTENDEFLVLENGEEVNLEHIGCPECGGMLTRDDE